jgi:hypothetical protein
MTFPATELPIRVKIAPGADPNLTPADWPNWVNISQDVRLGTSDRIEFSDGRTSEDTDVDASRMRLTLDNGAHDDGRVAGRYVVGNPLSPYYGLLTRNTPIYAGLEIASDSFARSFTDGWDAPDGAQFEEISWTVTSQADHYDVNGSAGTRVLDAPSDNVLRRATLTNGDAYNVTGRVTFATSAVTTGGPLVVGVTARWADGNNFYLLELQFNASGELALGISRQREGAFNSLGVLTIAETYTANEEITFAWQLVGATISLKAWAAAGTEPDGWQHSVTDDEVIEGAQNAIVFWRKTAVTNPGTITISVKDYVLEHIEFAGFVRDWPARWDITGNNAFVPIECAGILDRLRVADRGSKVVQSPLYRQLSSYESALYLPLEDESSAVRPANAAAGGVGGYFDGSVSAGVTSDLPGAARVIQFGSDVDRLRGYPRQDLAKGTGFSALWLLKFDQLPGSAHDMIIVATNTGATADRWVIRFDAASINIRGFRASDLVDIVPASPVLYGLNPLEWFAVELRLSVSGGTTTWRIGWTQVGTSGFIFNSGTYASSTIPFVTSTDVRANSDFVGAQISHHWVGQNTLPFFSQTFADVWAGFPNETSRERFARILSEAGIAGYVEPGDSEEQGPQEIDTSLAILRSSQNADQGIMYESGWGAALRPRANRYQRTVTLELDAADGALAVPPEGGLDRPGIVNDVSISRLNGAQNVRYSDEEHVAREGRYPQAPTVNIADDDRLLTHASWLVFQGARPGYRWPRISVNLARNTGYINAWRSRPYGARLQVVNEPAHIVGQAPDVIVEGQTTTWGKFTWAVDANCSDATGWEHPTIEDDSGPRFDTDGSELDAGIDSDDMSFTVDVTAGLAWVDSATYPDEFPMELAINGEVIRVSACTAPAGTLQTFTVDTGGRAVNGVVRSHDAGSAVTLAYPDYIVL